MADRVDQVRALRSERLAEPEPTFALEERIRRRRRRQRVVASAALTGFVVVILGSVALIRSGSGHSPPAVTPAPEVTTSTTEPAGTTPSQSAEDAARDGVLPVIAAAPTAVRVDARASVDTNEGGWVLSRAPLAIEGLDTGNACLDTDGRAPWTITQGCLAGYGEILLLDPHGEIERAFPMPGVPPTWITVTDRFVYAGRQGDGGYPDSSLVRIERSTLTVETAVFRSDGPNPSLPALATWNEFDSQGLLDPILDPDEGSGTTVTSWTKPDLRVDLTAVDDLFGRLPA